MTAQKITLDIPDEIPLVKKTDGTTFAREMPLLAAVKMYELGRLSSGRAAPLASVTVLNFACS